MNNRSFRPSGPRTSSLSPESSRASDAPRSRTGGGSRRKKKGKGGGASGNAGKKPATQSMVRPLDRRSGFSIWSDIEELQGKVDPANTHADVFVSFDDGRRYLLKAWTYQYLASRLEEICEESGEEPLYLIPPDILMRRMEPELLEAAIRDIVQHGDLDFSSDIAPLGEPDDERLPDTDDAPPEPDRGR